MNRTPLSELVRVLLDLGSYGDRLDPATATDEQLDIVARAVDEARRLTRTAQGPASGCTRHPNGPTDPTRGGVCLFCSGRRRTPPPDGPPLEDVLRDVAELGHDEAARRHTGRLVTRALAAAGRGTHTYAYADRPRTGDQEESHA